MRRTAVFALLVGIWAMGPTMGSPASLYVMPTVAVIAVWEASSTREALLLSVGSMAAMAVGWVLVGIAGGARIVDRTTRGAGLVLAHAVAVALLVGLAAWAAPRLRSLASRA